MEGGGIRNGRSYGAESVKNVEFARSKRSSEMNGTKSSLPYALGVSLEKMKKGFRKYDKKSAQTDQEHPQPPREATSSSPGARSRGQGRNV